MFYYHPSTETLMFLFTIPSNTIPNGTAALLYHLALAFNNVIATSEEILTLSSHDLIHLLGNYVV